MRRLSLLLLASFAMAAFAGCGDTGGEASGEPKPAKDDTEAPATTEPRDRSPFCVAIRALEAMGTDQTAAPRTPEAVLTQNSELTKLIEQAAAGVPSDAPADVRVLFSDYQALSSAVATAEGDTEAAFAALVATDPELSARLSKPDAHKESFVFFAERCGTTPPS